MAVRTNAAVITCARVYMQDPSFQELNILMKGWLELHSVLGVPLL